MSWVAVAVGGAAVIGAGISAVSSANTANTIANSANATAAQQLAYLRAADANVANAVEQGLVDLNTAYEDAIKTLQPAVSAGNAATAQYQKLLTDPMEISRRPTYQYAYNQGADTLQAQLSKGVGGGVSGSSMAAAIEYGQNFAASALDQELKRYTPLMAAGNEATTNTAQLQAGQGNATANLRLAGTSEQTQLANTAASALANANETESSALASSSSAQSSILNNLLSSLASVGYQKYSSTGMFSSTAKH